MKSTQRLLPALVAAALLSLPGISSEGGEGAGGTGVWILPSPKYVGAVSLSVPVSGAPAPATPWTNDLKLAADVGVSTFTAVLIDDLSGSPMDLPVEGREVLLKQVVLEDLVASGVGVAHIVVVDTNQIGYVVRIAIDPDTHKASLSLR